MMVDHQRSSETRMIFPGRGLTTLALMCALAVLVSATSVASQVPSALLLSEPRLPVGSWQAVYDVPAFGRLTPTLLSFGIEGVLIETVFPVPTPVEGLGTVILSNGHGNWEAKGPGEFVYRYLQLVYQADGVTPFGTAWTQAEGFLVGDGTDFQATLTVEFRDTTGQSLVSVQGTANGSKL